MNNSLNIKHLLGTAILSIAILSACCNVAARRRTLHRQPRPLPQVVDGELYTDNHALYRKWLDENATEPKVVVGGKHRFKVKTTL